MTLFDLSTILFAILGLGFLVFIHELGHYLSARKQGMRVEAFAIGFGKPIFSWERNGVKWRLCILPFGGYVKIAGMQKEGTREPADIPDGFFGKKPIQRVQVALAGPLVNIAFAFIVFTILWISGGRDKSFAEYTHRIGAIDPQSQLYQNGVRPGDIVEKYNGHPFHGFKDLLIAGLMKNESIDVQGFKVNQATGFKEPFHYQLRPYNNGSLGNEKFATVGIVSPARYLFYKGEFLKGSPIAASGIEPKDRILWSNGEMVFSHQQLSHLTNEATVFLTIQRDDRVIHTKVPRVPINELAMTMSEKGEIDDWQHEAQVKGRLSDLMFIPYNISPDLFIEGDISFIDEGDQKKAWENLQTFVPLQEGDRILALDSLRVRNPYELLNLLQNRRQLLIVDRNPQILEKVSLKEAEQQFGAMGNDLQKMVQSIGTDKPIQQLGTLVLLKPIEPKPLRDFPLNEAQKAQLAQEVDQSKKAIDAMKDPAAKISALKEFEKDQKKLVLGLPLMDREIRYNPTPGEQFIEVFHDTYRTLYSLFTGVASPKYVAGPVGIVQIVHQSWMIGAKEALFWLALISLNLGIINLLPLPVLDGGHILFSFIEMVTKRPIKPKMMEKMIVPFVVLLIGFFIFVTYHDIARLLSKFF